MSKANQNILFASVIVVGILALGAVAYFAPSLDKAKEQADVKILVTDFGQHLKNVPLSGSEDISKPAIRQNYEQYVTDDLLQQWLQNPSLLAEDNQASLRYRGKQ